MEQWRAHAALLVGVPAVGPVGHHQGPSPASANPNSACADMLPSQECSVSADQADIFLQKWDQLDTQMLEKRGRKAKTIKELLSKPGVSARHVQLWSMDAHESSNVGAGGCVSSVSSSVSTSRLPPVALHRDLQSLPAKAQHSGLFGTSNLASIIEEVLNQKLQSDAHDSGLCLLASHVLNTKEYHLCSGVVLQKLLDMTSSQLHIRTSRLASALWHVQECFRHRLEQQICQGCPLARRICFVESACYAETPMPTTVKRKVEVTQPGQVLETTELDQVDVEYGQDALLLATSSKAKLLQTRRKFGCMLKLPSAETVLLLMDSWTPLQCMQSTSGGITLSCLLQTCGAHPSLQSFQQMTRCVCSDLGGGNLKAEAVLLEARGEGAEWSHLEHYCEVHGVARSFEKTFQGLMGDMVSGLVHYALALGSADAMGVFRDAMVQVVQERLALKTGQPRESCHKFKESILSQYMDTATDGSSKIFLLLAVLSGDWQNHTEIEVYPENLPIAVSAMRSLCPLVSTVLVQCLCSAQPKVWPRHQWVGAKKSVNDITILGHIHGLLQPVFKRFAQMLGTHVKPSSGQVVASAEPGATEAVHTGTDLDDGLLSGSGYTDHPLLPLDSVGQSAGGRESVQDADYGGGQADPVSHAVLNKRYREQGLAWVMSQPLAKLSVVRVAMEPLTKLLLKHLTVGSKEWEDSQRHKSCMNAGELGSIFQRDYPLTLAADSTLDEEFSMIYRIFGANQANGLWCLRELGMYQ